MFIFRCKLITSYSTKGEGMNFKHSLTLFLQIGALAVLSPWLIKVSRTTTRFEFALTLLVTLKLLGFQPPSNNSLTVSGEP
jgi:hypothetical protein